MDINYIVGSRSYNLAIEDSDIDIVQTWDGPYKLSFNPSTMINLIQVNRNEAVERLVKVDYGHLQWWFPAEVIEKNALSDYMLHERERFVKANTSYIYKMLFEHAEAFRMHSDWAYFLFPKRLAYSTLYYAILSKYATGMPMEYAHRANGELKEQLLAMRHLEMSLEEALPINEWWRDQAIKCADYFNTPPDEKYLTEVHANLSKMLGVNTNERR